VPTTREDTKRVAFHLPKDLDREVEILVAELETGKSAFATRALREAVRRARKAVKNQARSN
jgi:metal-responsive CopG/Arc/MetJ family transcriptional regulator